MMKLTMKYMALTLVLLLFGASSALAIPADWPSTYGNAWHETTDWQELASPTSTTGVYWSIDGGATWTQDTDLKMKVGQTIEFRFDMHKKNVGTHYADFLKAWVDWDNDGTFDLKNNSGVGDEIIYAYQKLSEYESGNLASYNTPNHPDTSFYSAAFAITEEMYGDLYLRARVTCSESLGSNNPYWGGYDAAFLATGYLGQGEVEEWKLSISKTPIPPSLLLFGSGLLGLAFTNRKRFMK